MGYLKVSGVVKKEMSIWTRSPLEINADGLVLEVDLFDDLVAFELLLELFIVELLDLTYKVLDSLRE